MEQGDDTEVGSEYSCDIPEGEVRQTSRDTYKKHLPAAAFSHYESRDEVCILDYTPCINRTCGVVGAGELPISPCHSVCSCATRCPPTPMSL